MHAAAAAAGVTLTFPPLYYHYPPPLYYPIYITISISCLAAAVSNANYRVV